MATSSPSASVPRQASTLSLAEDLHRILRLQQPVSASTQTLPLALRTTSTQCPPASQTVEIQTESMVEDTGNSSHLYTRSEEELSLAQLNDIQSTKPVIRELGLRMLQELTNDTYRSGLTSTSGLSISPYTMALNVLEQSLDELNRDNDNTNEPVLLRTFTQAFAQPDEQPQHGINSTSSSPPNSASPSTSSVPYRYLPCTGLSWNVSGSLLAACFGHRDHHGWCHHRAGVAVWNAFRAPTNTKTTTTGNDTTIHNTSSCNAWKAEYVLDTDSCITSVAFHPDEAGIIAAGTVNGDIYVWNIFSNSHYSATTSTPSSTLSSSSSSSSIDEPLLCRSRTNDYIHREPVMNLCWNFDHVSRTYTLLSLSREGKLHLWSIQNKLNHPLSSAQLMLSGTKLRQQQQRFKGKEEGKRRYDDSDDDLNNSDDEPFPSQRNSKRSSQRLSGSNVGSIGGTCCTFPLQGKQGTQSGFFVGGEGGGIYTCTLSVSAAAIATSSQKEGSQWRPVHRQGAINKAENTIPWEQAAVEILLRVPELERARVCRMVERYAREANSTIITLGLLYACRIEDHQTLTTNSSTTGQSTTISTPATKGILFPNPIKFSLLPHTGSVLALASSPYHRNLVASGGTDGKIHLYSGLLTEPLLIFEPFSSVNSKDSVNNTQSLLLRNTITPIYSLAWSPIRPLVFAGGCGNGTVVVYDLYQQTFNTPVLVLPYQDIRNVVTTTTANRVLNNGTNSSSSSSSTFVSVPYLPSHLPDPSVPDGSIVTVHFNPSYRRILATSDSYGRIMVWKLPWNYGRPENQEEVALNRFMSYALMDPTNNASGGSSRNGTEDETGSSSSSSSSSKDRVKDSTVTTGGQRDNPPVWKDLEIQAEHTNSLASLWRKWTK